MRLLLGQHVLYSCMHWAALCVQVFGLSVRHSPSGGSLLGGLGRLLDRGISKLIAGGDPPLPASGPPSAGSEAAPDAFRRAPSDSASPPKVCPDKSLKPCYNSADSVNLQNLHAAVCTPPLCARTSKPRRAPAWVYLCSNPVHTMTCERGLTAVSVARRRTTCAPPASRGCRRSPATATCSSSSRRPSRPTPSRSTPRAPGPPRRRCQHGPRGAKL